MAITTKFITRVWYFALTEGDPLTFYYYREDDASSNKMVWETTDPRTTEKLMLELITNAPTYTSTFAGFYTLSNSFNSSGTFKILTLNINNGNSKGRDAISFDFKKIEELFETIIVPQLRTNADKFAINANTNRTLPFQLNPANNVTKPVTKMPKKLVLIDFEIYLRLIPNGEFFWSSETTAIYTQSRARQKQMQERPKK